MPTNSSTAAGRGCMNLALSSPYLGPGEITIIRVNFGSEVIAQQIIGWSSLIRVCIICMCLSRKNSFTIASVSVVITVIY